MPGKKTIFIVDDDPGVRDSLALLLGLHGMQVQTFCDAGSFLSLNPGPKSGCVLIDIRMDSFGGLELQQSLKSRNICLPVIVITGHPTVASARVAFRAGAIDYLPKPLSEAELLTAIELAFATETAAIERQLPDTAMLLIEQLTQRECQVLSLLMTGLSSREIAERLRISHSTVETYKLRMMRRLKVRKVSELVRIGTRALPWHAVS